MAAWSEQLTGSAIQPCLLAIAGVVLLFLLGLVATLVHSAGRRKAANPSTAAANAQAAQQSRRRRTPAPTTNQPVVSVRAYSCQASAAHHFHVEVVAQQPDVPGALDQALKRSGAGALKAAAGTQSHSSSPLNNGSTSLSTALAAADGSAVIRKRLPQHQGSKSSLRAATPSPRTSSHRPAQQAVARSPKLLHAPSACRLAPIRIDTCPDSDISTPSSSPCADPPAGLAWVSAHAEPCADLSCNASTPSQGVVGTAVVTSPVAGLIEPTQEAPAPEQDGLLQPRTDHSQHTLAGVGTEGNSSSYCFNSSGQYRFMPSTVLQDNAGTAQTQLAVPLCATCGCLEEAMHACTGLLPVQIPSAQVGDNAGQTQAPGCSSGSAGCTPGGLPAKSNRQLHVRFAPLPPSKNIWLQQLRQMSPDSKEKFLRRLQSAGRKMWCMWRKRRRQHTGSEPAQGQGHGLKRVWQEAAAVSGLDSVDEPAVSPCKRLMFTSAE